MMPSEGQYFRANVGALITDERWYVLACERSDVPGAWQLPQGGIEAGEEPLDAVRREIAEETGISWSHLRLVAQYPDLLAYELPPDARSEKTGRGQVQYWFVFRCDDAGAVAVRAGREFANWQWMPFERLIATAVAFRRPVYEKLGALVARLRTNESDLKR